MASPDESVAGEIEVVREIVEEVYGDVDVDSDDHSDGNALRFKLKLLMMKLSELSVTVQANVTLRTEISTLIKSKTVETESILVLQRLRQLIGWRTQNE
ncbi:MAG: hypothetical protein JW384_02983 [Nitrosomonadaceae bacterium]|nr:hypothetical protein [Nitrosomonadaceae bacterium]